VDENQIRKVLCDILGIPLQEAPADLKMGAHPRWDSLGHMNVILEMEKKFGVHFPSYLLAQLTSVEALTRAITQAKNGGA
jgi:acyl carrier protein